MDAPSTIFALSSGRPPAGIAIIRISGPRAGAALQAFAGRLPSPRRAGLATIRDPQDGEPLDQAMVLWMPGPDTATGDDVAELHLHGGRAIVDAVTGALGRQEGLRAAEPGEFTRRAFDNGRIDFNEAEGLADLLSAETEGQRRSALLNVGGAMSRLIAGWEDRLLAISASIEAAIDHSDEEDGVTLSLAAIDDDVAGLMRDIAAALARPPSERLRDGLRVVLAGPPNSGKSSLLNVLCGRDAAIASPMPGTTRDLIEVPVSLGGLPLVFIDTAGLRVGGDAVEAEGIERAYAALESADIILWLGDDGGPDLPAVIRLHARADVREARGDRLAVSVVSGAGIDQLVETIVDIGRDMLPREGEVALTRRHRDGAAEILRHLALLQSSDDVLIAAEHARETLAVCDRLSGRAGVENMLDNLFARFCIGK